MRSFISIPHRKATSAVLIGALAAFFGMHAAIPAIELRLALRGSPPNPEHPTIVMLGDSHTEFVNWPLLMNCPRIANHGVGGNTTAQIVRRLPETLALKPKLLILMAGTNDALGRIPETETLANLAVIKRLTTERGIEYVSLTPPPLPGRSVTVPPSSVMIPFTDGDLLDDKVHLRRSGYAKWRAAVAPFVRKFC